MSHPSILDLNQTYTFSKYFELNADPEELFAELGVKLESQNLNLPKALRSPQFLSALEARINRGLQLIDVTTEMARREILISPILFEVCSLVNQKIKIVNKWLKKICTANDLPLITTYWARHSYASLLKQSGQSVELIREMLGHSDIKTTESYLKRFDLSKKREANESIQTLMKKTA